MCWVDGNPQTSTWVSRDHGNTECNYILFYINHSLKRSIKPHNIYYIYFDIAIFITISHLRLI